MKYNIVLILLIHRSNYKELLLVKRKREPGIGKWSLPGGTQSLESEPDPFKAVVREAYMDFSVKFDPKLYNFRFEEVEEPTLYIYFSGKISGKPKVRPETKTIDELGWFKITDILKMDMAFEGDKPVIKRFSEEFSS